MVILGLIMIFGSVILFETPRLLKGKMWGELMAFSGLLGVSMIMTFAHLFKIPLPNPTAAVDLIFGPISEVIVSLFE